MVERGIQLSENALDCAVELLQPRFVFERVGSIDLPFEFDDSFLQQRTESLNLVAAQFDCHVQHPYGGFLQVPHRGAPAS
jgi:hypothetical protein